MYRFRVSVHSVSILILLIIKNSDSAPKVGVMSVSDDSLLISVESLLYFSQVHADSAKEVPGLSVVLIRFKGHLESSDGFPGVILMEMLEPAEVLECFRVARIFVECAFVHF